MTSPAELATTVPQRGDADVSRPPIEYTLFDHNDSLGIRMNNTSDAPILIIGERSYVVDPSGATHQMNGGTIAPRSHISFRLPPSTRVYRSGPQFGVGVGVGGGRGGTFFGTGVGSTWDGYPANYGDAVVTTRPWRWGTGDVQLHVVYEHGAERAEHDFVFRRERLD